MAPHSSTLAWKIPWTEEPGGLQSMGSLRTRLSNFTWTFHFHALEKEMATHSSILAWKIPWTEKLGRLHSIGSVCRELGMTEGSGTPLQYSCLENPMDWWAAVHVVSGGQT